MKFSFGLLFSLFFVMAANAQFLEKKGELKKFDGYFDFYYSEDHDEIYLEVDKLDQDFLYVHSLTTGLGSNDIGLDRGQLGDGVLVKFIKSGNKILLLQPNQDYRAITDNTLEKRSVEQAFAKSVLFGFKIEEKKGENYIINLTPFLMQDTHGVASRLKRMKEGSYALDKTRNTLWMPNTKAFPKNVEFEAMLTFKGTPTGRNVRSVAPDSGSLTVVQHHSFVELPDDKYTPRAFDPRSGAISMSYLDYATPIWEPIRKRIIVRHRLEKKNPELAVSEAVEPIIYYLDPGTPEPVRSALLEGGRWWNQAYESIGYKDAFQVKMLPEGADPMDLRYNVIQWVHRSTRGWSYGASITDPRTGEILKGHVSLGSLRIRQDFMIAQALMNQPFANSDDNYGPMLEMALARIRQLSAHEIGHTLGFAHNFAASKSGRASVMDYPHPSLSFNGNQLDISNAYDTGIGDWDKVTVAYSYGDIPAGADEKSILSKLLEDAYTSGLQFISDSDARAQGGAHAYAHLWDNGANAVDELNAVLALRKQAIANFSEHNIRTGDPYTVLEDVFVPLYFYHRYQTEAAVKLIGGLDYNYKVKGDNATAVRSVSGAMQSQALRAIFNTLSVEALAIPEEKLELFPPRAFGYWRGRESFSSKTGMSFDALSAAATSADMTLGLLLHPERANRMIQESAAAGTGVSFSTVLSMFDMAVFTTPKGTAYQNEVARTIQFAALQHIIKLAANPRANGQVKAIVMSYLDTLEQKFNKSKDYFDAQLAREIAAYKKDPEDFKPASAPNIPDGSPIGSFQCLNNQEK
ncbi:MAG: zinc-dependent metalloprotease [Gilvibacter sp.]